MQTQKHRHTGNGAGDNKGRGCGDATRNQKMLRIALKERNGTNSQSSPKGKKKNLANTLISDFQAPKL